mmetsp:Transcript_17777/g.54364  ORF Transcript_17777/g.54364 Transcript_17777/m.54364 type:complete len:239 (+) Transcript_17777:1477-2193(+)
MGALLDATLLTAMALGAEVLRAAGAGAGASWSTPLASVVPCTYGADALRSCSFTLAESASTSFSARWSAAFVASSSTSTSPRFRTSARKSLRMRCICRCSTAVSFSGDFTPFSAAGADGPAPSDTGPEAVDAASPVATSKSLLGSGARECTRAGGGRRSVLSALSSEVVRLLPLLEAGARPSSAMAASRWALTSAWMDRSMPRLRAISSSLLSSCSIWTALASRSSMSSSSRLCSATW